jgi:hypothetical protein
MKVPLVPLVHEGGGGHLACELLDLIELAFERLAIIRILRAANGAHREPLVGCYGEAGLHAELGGLVRLPLESKAWRT